jgi:glycosyltransferase involved in cell wall biosynthesis
MSENKNQVTVIIPAFNEEKTIGDIILEVRKYGYQVVVVDDGSYDKTVEIARKSGATVISHIKNKGYLEALRTGFRLSNGNIFVTMDADGQHNPADIPRLVKPILDDCADLVIGAREQISSFSERILTMITRFRIDTQDASSGFKALRKSLAERMEIRGRCICGTFVLEAHKLGAKVLDVKVKVNKRTFGKSRMRNKHVVQFFLVLKELII